MINIFLSVFLFAAVKAIFLWVFGPNGQRFRLIPGPSPELEDGVSLHGMTITHADKVNQDLLAFLKT